jgi:tetratricopeptide repeat protein 21B
VKYLSGDNNEAKNVLRRIIEQEATYSDAYILLAQVYTREGNSHAAYDALEQGLSYNFDLKTHPIYHLIRARILKKEQKYEEACKLLQNALSLPGVKKRRQSTDTIKTPRTKSEQNVSGVTISLQDRVSVYLELAEIQLLLNRVNEASLLLQEASIEFQGTSEESRILLTNVDLSVKRGDINQAIEILTQIKADQAYYVQAREKLADIYLKHRRDKKLFIKTYKELVERDPTPQALVILGDAYMSIMEVCVFIFLFKNSPT